MKLFGKERHIRTVRASLDEDGVPHMEGMVMYNGRPPFSERIKRRYDRDCVNCERDESYLSGEFKVAVATWRFFGLPIWRATEFANFTCLECLHEQDPVTYPYTDLSDYMENRRTYR